VEDKEGVEEEEGRGGEEKWRRKQRRKKEEGKEGVGRRRAGGGEGGKPGKEAEEEEEEEEEERERKRGRGRGRGRGSGNEPIASAPPGICPEAGLRRRTTAKPQQKKSTAKKHRGSSKATPTLPLRGTQSHCQGYPQGHSHSAEERQGAGAPKATSREYRADSSGALSAARGAYQGRQRCPGPPTEGWHLKGGLEGARKPLVRHGRGAKGRR